MDNNEKVKEINSLDLNDMKTLFSTYLANTKKFINKADNPLDVIQHVNNLNVVLTRDIGKFIN